MEEKTRLSMDPHEVLLIPEETVELNSLSADDVFTKYYTSIIITFIPAQTCLFAQTDRIYQTVNVTQEKVAKLLGII